MILRTTFLALFGLFLGTAVAGCGEEPPPPPPPMATYPIKVTVQTEAGVGIAKAPVIFGDKTVGFTDAEGIFKAQLTRQAGQDFKISVGEVDGFRYMTDSTVTEKLRTTDGGGSSQSGVPLALDVKAQSLRNDYFFWVRANCDKNLPEGSCAGLELKLDDEIVATTNDLGYAQFMVERVPETELTLVLDTPNYDPNDSKAVGMEPRDPEYKVTVGLEPQVYLIEEGFVDALAKSNRRSRPRRSRTSGRKRSSSKSKATKKPADKPKPKNDGVIDLF